MRLKPGWSKAKIKKTLLVLGLFYLVLASIAGILFSQSDLGVAAEKYESNKKEWERLGLLSTVEEYRAMIAVDPATNAGPEYKKFINNDATATLFLDIFYGELVGATDRLPGKPASKKTPAKNKPKRASKAKMLAVAKLKGKELLATINALEKMTQKPACVIPKNAATVMDTYFPEFAPTKNIITVLSVLAEDKLDQGTVKEALRLYTIIAKMCLWQDDEASMIPVLQRVACTNMLARSLRDSLEKHWKNYEFIKAIPGLLKLIDHPFDLERNLKAEGVVNQEMVRMIVSPGKNGLVRVFGTEKLSREVKLFLATLKVPMIRKAVLARTYEPFILTMKNRPTDKADYVGWQKAHAPFEKIERVRISKEPSYWLTKMVSLSFWQFTGSLVANDGRIAVLVQATAAAEYRLRTGRLPNRLLLTGKVGKDGDGTSLAFSSRGGFNIWSKGPNGVDDRGVLNLKLKKDDFGIRLR